MDDLVDDIAEIIDGIEGEIAAAALVTVLRSVLLHCAPSEKARLETIDDMTLFLKDTDHATQ